MKNKFLYAIVLFVIITISSTAQTTFQTDNTDVRNQAVFESNALLEDIVGVSNKVNVSVALDLQNIMNNPAGKVEVDLNALKTGINLRDEHLRSENWLNTSKYPKAEFVLESISDATSSLLSDGKKIEATFNGKFSVHGVTKNISATGELTYFNETEKTMARLAGNLLKVQAEFQIKLSDYGVQIPSMVVGKVNDDINISVNFIASDAVGK